MLKSTPFQKPSEIERTSTTLRDAKPLLNQEVSETQAAFKSELEAREARLQERLGLENLETLEAELQDLVQQVSTLVLTALESGKGRRNASVVGVFKDAQKKISEYHKSSTELRRAKSDLSSRANPIDLTSAEDLDFEIREAKSLRESNQFVETLEKTLFTLQQEIGGVLLPRLSGLVQSQWGEADRDLQMAHSQLNRAKTLVGKQASKVPSVNDFKKSVLSEVLLVLSEDETSSLKELRLYVSVLNEIEGALRDIQKGIKNVPNMAKTAEQQMRAKGFHENRDSIEKQWHKMNSALWRLDRCLAWLEMKDENAGSKKRQWLRVLQGQLERLTGMKFADISKREAKIEAVKAMTIETEDALPRAQDQIVSCPALPQASKAASTKGKRSPDKVVKKKVGKEPGPARPPKQAQPAVFGVESRESQESLDERRRREANERRNHADYQDFMAFANTLEDFPAITLEIHDLEKKLQAQFADILDSYITLLPEPLKRYLVNTLQMTRGEFDQDTEGKHSVRDAVIGYFVTHSQADFEKNFSAYVAGRKLEENQEKGLIDFSGERFELPNYNTLLDFMWPVVFEKLPAGAKEDWKRLKKDLASYRQQERAYKELRALVKAQQNTIKPEADVGAKRITGILEEVEKTDLIQRFKAAHKDISVTAAKINQIKADQVIISMSGPLYEFFGDRCAPTDPKTP